jgi:hypothetical protein
MNIKFQGKNFKINSKERGTKEEWEEIGFCVVRNTTFDLLTEKLFYSMQNWSEETKKQLVNSVF